MIQPVLSYPDWNKPFVLTTDASNEAIGAILSQGTIGKDKPLVFVSRTVNKTETRYSTTEKKLLAIIWQSNISDNTYTKENLKLINL